MKLAYFVIFLSLAVMTMMIFQTVNRELKLHNIKTGLVKTSEEVKRKEDDIQALKEKISGLKQTLSTVNVRVEDLKMKQDLALKTVKDQESKLEACNRQKEETVKKRTEVENASVQLHYDHEAAKSTAQEEIKNLKQQILDRDKAICEFADTAKEQARTLCGIA